MPVLPCGPLVAVDLVRHLPQHLRGHRRVVLGRGEQASSVEFLRGVTGVDPVGGVALTVASIRVPIVVVHGVGAVVGQAEHLDVNDLGGAVDVVSHRSPPSRRARRRGR